MELQYCKVRPKQLRIQFCYGYQARGNSNEYCYISLVSSDIGSLTKGKGDIYNQLEQAVSAVDNYGRLQRKSGQRSTNTNSWSLWFSSKARMKRYLVHRKEYQ